MKNNLIAQYVKTGLIFIVIGFPVILVLGELLIPRRWIELRYTTTPFKNRINIKIEQKILVIGDSVSGQIFNQEHPRRREIFPYPLNQDHTLLGQYFLLSRLLEANSKRIQHVVLAIVPQSLCNNLDHPTSYRAVLGGLFQFENLDSFSPTALRLMARWPGFGLMLFSVFKSNPGLLAFDYGVFAPKNFDFNRITRNKAQISDLSADYLRRMVDLTQKHGSSFSVLFLPVSETGDTDLSLLQKQVKAQGLETPFKGAFEGFFALPANQFHQDDHMHILKQYLPSVADRMFVQLRKVTE